MKNFFVQMGRTLHGMSQREIDPGHLESLLAAAHAAVHSVRSCSTLAASRARRDGQQAAAIDRINALNGASFAYAYLTWPLLSPLLCLCTRLQNPAHEDLMDRAASVLEVLVDLMPASRNIEPALLNEIKRHFNYPVVRPLAADGIGGGTSTTASAGSSKQRLTNDPAEALLWLVV